MRVLKNRRVRDVLIAVCLITAAEGGVLGACFRSMEDAVERLTEHPLFYNSVPIAVSAAQRIHKHYFTLMIVTACIAVLLVICAFLVAETLHSKKVNAFHLKIDRILHGAREMSFGTPREGDFESLESSVCKMVDALYSQQDALQSEKNLLADALANISHQMKLPLSMIRMAMDLIAADPDMDPVERALRIERAQGHIDRITEFVKLLLRVSRLDAGVVRIKSEDFKALDAIRMAVMDLEELIDDREIDLRLDALPDVTLHGDQFLFTEALKNIIKNSIEYSETGGLIFITVRKDPVRARIEIRDTGPGIDPEEKLLIFERFHRGKNARSGSAGIGLNLAWDLINRMGGEIEADNHEQGGAVFTIKMDEVNV